MGTIPGSSASYLQFRSLSSRHPQFQWQKDRVNIGSNNPRFSSHQTDSTSTFQIQRVKESDKGHYRCLVKTVEQSGKPSQEAELTVGKFVVPFSLLVIELYYHELVLMHPPFVHYLESEMERRRLLDIITLMW